MRARIQLLSGVQPRERVPQPALPPGQAPGESDEPDAGDEHALPRGVVEQDGGAAADDAFPAVGRGVQAEAVERGVQHPERPACDHGKQRLQVLAAGFLLREGLADLLGAEPLPVPRVRADPSAVAAQAPEQGPHGEGAERDGGAGVSGLAVHSHLHGGGSVADSSS